MILRVLKILLAVAAALLLLASAATYWLLRTESGTDWLWRRATAASPGMLSAESIRGTLRSGLEVQGLRVEAGTTTISVGRLSLGVDPDLLPLRLNVDDLLLDGVVVRSSGKAAPKEEAATPVADVLDRMQLPVPIVVRNLVVRHVQVDPGDGDASEVLTSLALAGRLGDALGIERLAIVTPWGSVSGTAEAGLQPPYGLQAGLRAHGTLQSPGNDAGRIPLDARIAITGDPQNLAIDINDEARELRLHGTVSLEDALQMDLTLAARRLSWPLDSDDAIVVVESLDLHARGQPADYTVEANGDVTTRWTGRTATRASATGNLQGLHVDALELDADQLAATATADLTWDGPFGIDGHVAVAHADPALWVPGLDGDTYIHGSVTAGYTRERLVLDELDLRQGGTDLSIRGDGVIDVQKNVIAAELKWKSLQWPLAPALATVDSSSGSLTIDGAPSDWRAAGDIALSAPQLPEGRFRVHGTGDLGGAQATIDDSDVLGGHVNGSLSYSWRGAQRWTAALTTKDTQVTPLLPGWPGYISTQFTASGQRTPFRLDLDIRRLTGALRSRALDASGRVAVVGKNVRVNDLDIRSGGSHLRLDGDVAAADGLAFDIDIASLADLVPGAGGQVQARGTVKEGDTLPELTLAVHAAEFSWDKLRIAEISATNDAEAGLPLALALQASAIDVDERRIDELAVTLHGTPGEHRLGVDASAGASSANLQFDGGVDNWRTPADIRWAGRISGLNIAHADALDLELREPAALSLARGNAELERACLDGKSGASVCAHGDWAHGGAFAATASLDALPLSLLRVVTGTELEFTQTVSGTLQMSRPAQGPVSGSGRVDLSPGQIRNPQDRRLTLGTRAGFASFELDQGNLLSGELSLPFSSAAEIAARFNVVDVRAGPASKVEGRVQVNVGDIGVARSILPVVDEVGGALKADIRIGGSVAAPAFSGGATIGNGLVAYSGLGLRLDDIQLQADIREDNRLELTSSFRAGEGRGRLTTSADYQKGREAGLELSLAGDNLTIVNVPDLKVIANADLRLGLHDDNVSVNGRIVLPEARLSSARITSTSVSESGDVDFVGEVRPAETEEPETRSPLRFSGSVDVELGDRVAIDVNVAEARLRGKSTFTWDGPALPRASGLYEISGKFEAFGQLLEITEGSIRYPDVAADRPELRIRAEREIFGNSQVRRAGVLVTGTATNPRVEVYTTPATSEDRALTLLATGSDFNYEQGVGAVDVGTYIAPRLYASYGIGLFDRENVISVRYDLGRGFGFKATSGKRASGVDLSYTVEH